MDAVEVQVRCTIVSGSNSTERATSKEKPRSKSQPHALPKLLVLTRLKTPALLKTQTLLKHPRAHQPPTTSVVHPAKQLDQRKKKCSDGTNLTYYTTTQSIPGTATRSCTQSTSATRQFMCVFTAGDKSEGLSPPNTAAASASERNRPRCSPPTPMLAPKQRVPPTATLPICETTKACGCCRRPRSDHTQLEALPVGNQS